MIIILVSFNYVYYSQTDKVSELFKNCERNRKIDTLSSKINFPNSNGVLYLPDNCKGEFSGELPSLYIFDTLNSDKKIRIRAAQVWNTYPKGEYYNHLKIEYKDIARYTYLNHEFILYKNDQKQLELCCHLDDSINSENHWMWMFKFYISPNQIDEEIACSFHSVVRQVVEETLHK
ncbi:MAG: hypothetical protein N4A35_15515 [Flavobacteriales bacterium]|jgi:hypothetical protein|nr:hypothetical protein [Flavobacteriales bacterium]